MFWLLLSFSAFAQDDLDLSAIQILDEELPDTEYSERAGQFDKRKHTSQHRHPYKKTPLNKILESGIERGHIKAGKYLIRISDNKSILLTEAFYGKFYKLQDDLGFKYLLNNDGSCVYKLRTEAFNSIELELELYEPPLKYTPAPTNITRSEFDKKLKILPEATLLVGMVQGDYMRDLFNDTTAESGVTNQLGINFATGWNLPVNAGLVFHYEKSNYDLRGGGNILYSSLSFGPQFKSKDFDVWGQPLRFQTQFRVSPFARLTAETTQGDVNFKFNSSDLLLSTEHPIKNQIGEFVIGIYFQAQWLNIKDQPETVKINATNEINKSLGFSVAQVFE